VFSAGGAWVDLDNTARLYDPAYAAGTHFGDFKRNTPVRIVGWELIGTATFADASDTWTVSVTHGLAVGDRVRFTASGATEPSTYAVTLSATLGGGVLEGAGSDSDGTWTLYRLDTQWYGYAKTWRPSYAMPTESRTRLSATDGLGLLAQYEVDDIAEAHGGDFIGERIDRVLDDFGFPSGYRSLDDGVTLQATEFGVNALAHCQRVALSVGGTFYAQRDGTLTFDGYEGLSSSRQITSQDTVGHNAAPVPLNDGSLELSGVGTGYRDLVTISALDGEAVTIDNSGANEAPVAYRKTNLLHNSEAQTSLTAQFFADLYGTEVPAPEKVRFVAKTINADVNTVLFKRKLRDRITVEVGPPGGGADISHECFINGARGKGQGGLWTIELLLSSAEAYDDNLAAGPAEWLILDDATVGKLDTGKLGY
jgi:hypothetical protein